MRLRRMLLGLLLLPIYAASVRADAFDDQFVAGLNERRLFALSEAHCRRRLADAQLGDVDRADATIALCRTLVEHALNTPRSQREPIWQAAEAAAEDFRRAAPSSARRVLVDLHHALAVVARGELARQEAELGAPGAPSLEEARR
ncbi:MAG: hypothetical protein KDA41_12485, partial [Planctomycetales bacterium]|nr:hypothetical protein [Planctomycetales bacterium]